MCAIPYSVGLLEQLQCFRLIAPPYRQWEVLQYGNGVLTVNEVVSPTRCQWNQYHNHLLLYEGKFQDFQDIMISCCHNYLSKTWCHGWLLGDCSIAIFSKSLMLPNVYSLILYKLLHALIGFRRLDMGCHTGTALEYTWSERYDMRHVWYMVP